MGIVADAVGMVVYLALPISLFGYWFTMRNARVGAALAGFAAGVGVGLPAGGVAGLGTGVGGAALGAIVAHLDDALGRGLVGGAAGVLVGLVVAGTANAVLMVGAVAALSLGVSALAWRFPRATLPVATSALGGLLVVAVVVGGSPDGGSLATASSNLLAVGVVVAFFGVMLQPWTAEIGDSVPPLLPLFVRNWFDLVPEGRVDDAICPNCGRPVDPNAERCEECEESLAGMIGPVAASDTAGASDRANPDASPASNAGAGAPADAAMTGKRSDDAGAAGAGATSTAAAAAAPDAVGSDQTRDYDHDGGDPAAVDVPCPSCGVRPVEERATGVGLVGMLVFYRYSRRSFVGCHECNRRRLWLLAGKNAVLGWWSITALVNPFAILWNLGRGAVDRGPTPKLERHLAGAGIDFEYLDDRDEFDPSRHADHELLLRGLLRLGVAVMLADGDADPLEAAAVRDNALELFPDQDEDRLEERIQEYADGTTYATKIAEGLEETLTANGRQLALRFAAEVAVVDGDVTDAEARLLATIADGLGLSEGAVEAAIGNGVSTADAPDPATAI